MWINSLKRQNVIILNTGTFFLLHSLTEMADNLIPVRTTDVILSPEHRWSCNRGSSCCETVVFIWCCWKTGSSQCYFHYDNVNLLQNFQRRAMRVCVVQREIGFYNVFAQEDPWHDWAEWLSLKIIFLDPNTLLLLPQEKGFLLIFRFSLTYIF